MCLDANSNDYPNYGDNIQLWGCNTHPEQEWVMTSAGQLKNASTGMCLDANSNDYPNYGDNIQLWGCNTHPEQEWVMTSAGQLKNASTGMCLDANSNDYPNNGDNIQLWGCNTHPEQEWAWGLAPGSWAGASFCASYGVRYMGTTYNGVAACGNAYPNNYQGKIAHNGVVLDTVGFQCVELAARYFYYVSGHSPPLVQDASDYAYYVGADYRYGVYPAGITGGTSTFQNSLTPGNIISMWSRSDQVGHVAVVTKVNVTGGNGTITVMDENASANGTHTITVSGGHMSYGGIYPDFQWTTNLPS